MNVEEKIDRLYDKVSEISTAVSVIHNDLRHLNQDVGSEKEKGYNRDGRMTAIEKVIAQKVVELEDRFRVEHEEIKKKIAEVDERATRMLKVASFIGFGLGTAVTWLGGWFK